MSYKPDIHKRHSVRLKEYDYSKSGMYFITICVKNRECLLGEVLENQVNLNKIGKIVEKELLSIRYKFKNCDIKVYQIMPNHIHFILEVKEKNETIIGNVVRCFKGRVSSKAKIFWQRNYYEHIIRNENEYFLICEYIRNNPLNWEEDNDYV